MPGHDQPTPYPEANRVLSALWAGAQGILGDELVGVYLYGSLASGEFDPRTSDVDLLVEFSHPVGFFQFSRVRCRLSEILGRQANLVTFAGLRDEIRERVLKESIDVA